MHWLAMAAGCFSAGAVADKPVLDQVAVESEEVYFPVLLLNETVSTLTLDDSFVRDKIQRLNKAPKADPRPPSGEPLPVSGSSQLPKDQVLQPFFPFVRFV